MASKSTFDIIMLLIVWFGVYLKSLPSVSTNIVFISFMVFDTKTMCHVKFQEECSKINIIIMKYLTFFNKHYYQ